MDREEQYWSNLEKLYVHNVYEKISHRYGEFIKLSDLDFNNNNHKKDESSDVELVVEEKCKIVPDNHHHHHNHHHNHHHQNGIDSSLVKDDILLNGHLPLSTNLTLDLGANGSNTSNTIGSHPSVIKIKQKNFRPTKSIRHSKHSPWPKVKKFLLQLDRFALIGN